MVGLAPGGALRGRCARDGPSYRWRVKRIRRVSAPPCRMTDIRHSNGDGACPPLHPRGLPAGQAGPQSLWPCGYHGGGHARVRPVGGHHRTEQGVCQAGAGADAAGAATACGRTPRMVPRSGVTDTRRINTCLIGRRRRCALGSSWSGKATGCDCGPLDGKARMDPEAELHKPPV